MLDLDDELGLIKNDVKVVWENIGEGNFGDYDEENPDDENLLRFSVYVLEDDEWIAVDDASYCTPNSCDTSDDDLIKMLRYLMREFYDVLHNNHECSVKKLGETMSWITV